MTGIDLTDLDLFAAGEVDAAWKRLRQAAPVHWNPEHDGPGFWAVTRHADVVSVARDTASFTSEKGMMLGVNRGAGDPAAGKMLVVTDPPRHGPLRAAVRRALTATPIGLLRKRVRDEVARLLEPARETSGCEFVSAVAARLPAAVTCDLMGVPAADRGHLLRLTSAAFGATDPDYQDRPTSDETAALAHAEILTYYADLIAERRRTPGSDVVSVLATTEVKGRGRLTDDEVLCNCLNLIIGGHETTRHAASGGLLALIEHPEQWALLRRARHATRLAVEEVLRWTSPGMYVLRTAIRDGTVADQPISRGDAVTLWNASANRDEAVFEAADSFDVLRQPNPHVAFGAGPHSCVGASIARLELQELFRQLLERASAVELAGAPERLRSNLVRGIKRLPVTFAWN